VPHLQQPLSLNLSASSSSNHSTLRRTSLLSRLSLRQSPQSWRLLTELTTMPLSVSMQCSSAMTCSNIRDRAAQGHHPGPLPDHGPGLDIRLHGPSQQRCSLQRRVRIRTSPNYPQPLLTLQRQQNPLPVHSDAPHIRLAAQPTPLRAARAARIRGERP
jgi:hypothetical protein